MKYVLFAVLALVAGCPLPPPQPQPYPPFDPDSGLPPFSPDAEPVPNVPEQAACSRMCNNMQRLGCPLGQPTPVRKEPCLSWCTRVQSKHEIDLHPDCIAAVSSCDRVRGCDN